MRTELRQAGAAKYSGYLGLFRAEEVLDEGLSSQHLRGHPAALVAMSQLPVPVTVLCGAIQQSTTSWAVKRLAAEPCAKLASVGTAT